MLILLILKSICSHNPVTLITLLQSGSGFFGTVQIGKVDQFNDLNIVEGKGDFVATFVVNDILIYTSYYCYFVKARPIDRLPKKL